MLSALTLSAGVPLGAANEPCEQAIQAAADEFSTWPTNASPGDAVVALNELTGAACGFDLLDMPADIWDEYAFEPVAEGPGDACAGNPATGHVGVAIHLVGIEFRFLEDGTFGHVSQQYDHVAEFDQNGAILGLHTIRSLASASGVARIGGVLVPLAHADAQAACGAATADLCIYGQCVNAGAPLPCKGTGGGVLFPALPYVGGTTLNVVFYGSAQSVFPCQLSYGLTWDASLLSPLDLVPNDE